MTAYTDAQRIANYLGLTLTTAQQDQAGVVAQAASDWVDVYKGRSWQAASPVTGEIQPVRGDTVWLEHRPVVNVTSVETRADVVGASWTSLAAGQYELVDPAVGKLRLVGWGDFLARVSYTHTGTIPPSYVALAATVIAAAWLQQTLAPGTVGVERLSVGQNDITMQFSAARSDVPAEALRLLGGRAVLIA